MASVQLDMFQKTTPDDILKAEIAELKQRQENMRRGLFARHSDVIKLVLSLQEQVDGLQFKLKEMKRGAA